MIRLQLGDLLEAKENIIIHQVNCQGRMGSGIAEQIKNKYPIVYKKYLELYNNTIDKSKLLGGCLYVRVDDMRTVANVFGQYNYGYDGNVYTNMNALVQGICKILLRANSDVALPYKIGCDRGGADWDKLYSILSILAEDFKHDIVIYKLN